MSAVRERLLLVAVVALSVAGVALAQGLVDAQLAFHAGTARGGLLCGETGVLSCSHVAAHPSSWLLGLPIALWGLWYFLALAGIGLCAFVLRPPDRLPFLALGAVLAGLGVLFDVYLAAVMAARIGSLCLRCVAAYVLNALLLVAYWRLLRRRGGPIRWRLLLPSRTADGADVDAHRNAVKAGLLASIVAAGAASMHRELSDLGRVRRTGVQQVSQLLGRLRSEPPDVDMAAFAGFPSEGPADAPLWIAAVLDFKCHFCRELERSLQRLLRRHAGRLRVSYVMLPMDADCNPRVRDGSAGHADACWLARGAACAARQGRYGEYAHHVIHETSLRALDRRRVLDGLAAMELDPERFLGCVDGEEARRAVAEQIAFLADLGITGTPALVIDGYVRSGTVSPWALERILAARLGGVE